MYKHHRHAVGGATPGSAHGAFEKRTDDTIEPVFLQTLPLPLFQTVLDAVEATSVVNMTSGDGKVEMSCVEMGLPCTGVCLTEEHAAALHHRLEEQVYLKMQDESSNLFQKSLKAFVDANKKKTTEMVLQSATADDDKEADEDGDDEAGGSRKRKSGKQGKTKKNTKAKPGKTKGGAESPKQKKQKPSVKPKATKSKLGSDDDETSSSTLESTS